ncbi:MAG: hydrogenase 4 subunit F [Rikenellaceae bacterium]|nr:hydrogenase 4 subunit F [Rikenellaceae bacterium]
MVLLILLVAFILTVVTVSCSAKPRLINNVMTGFCMIQMLSVILLFLNSEANSTLYFFNVDNIGLLFHAILAIVAGIGYFQGKLYLSGSKVRKLKIYNISFLSLCVALTGVYYSDNLVITWVFLEATTLASAGLVYHHRSIKNLEATWEYIFVSSVGLTIAYLGVLLLSTTVGSDGSLTYTEISNVFAEADPLYMKLAFLFTLIGYSTKMEVFPFFTVGIDANYSAPSPASAIISSSLVNGGFIAFYRIYQLTVDSVIYDWVKNVLLLTGIISIIIGAIYLRRTNNLKRFLSYSTVENIGMSILGLGLGGVAVFGSLLHIGIHSLVKSSLFLQVAKLGKVFGSYRINRMGNYMKYDNIGGMVLLTGMISLTALPPSALFVSELIILKQMVTSGKWIILLLFVASSCYVIYSICRRFLYILFKQNNDTPDLKILSDSKWKISSLLILVIILITMIVGIILPEFIVEFIKGIN